MSTCALQNGRTPTKTRWKERKIRIIDLQAADHQSELIDDSPAYSNRSSALR